MGAFLSSRSEELGREPGVVTPWRDRSRRLEEQRALHSLVRDVRGRDKASFDQLYDRTVQRVFTFAHHLLRNRSDAEEVVSEVYLAVWNRAHLYRHERGDVMAWLFIMCRSRAIDILRERRAQVRVRDACVRALGDHADAQSDGLADMLLPEHAMSEAFSALPHLRQQILALAFFRGLSHAEIAGELSLPLGTVKSHLRRGIADLRARIASSVDGSA